MWYNCYINNKKIGEIKRAIEDHEDFDEWGLIEYGDYSRAVEYNLCIDNSTEETEHLSAFYKLDPRASWPRSPIRWCTQPRA